MLDGAHEAHVGRAEAAGDGAQRRAALPAVPLGAAAEADLGAVAQPAGDGMPRTIASSPRSTCLS
ncbi:hypothetical protein [Streptomyces sp. NPDC047706]|uniref:hypothetical protein n=1 Tax=Streptomyces sp. NPDC047706 TaxID=3365486 RepID=UPI003720BAEF